MPGPARGSPRGVSDRRLIWILGGLALILGACTEPIELFPDLAPPDSAAADAAAAEGGSGCVPAVNSAGIVIPCVCKIFCTTDSDCPLRPDGSTVQCDAATGLCAGNDGTCRTRADCPAPRDPSTGGTGGRLCISAR